MDGRITVPNFVSIGQTAAEMAVFEFLRWQPSDISDFLYASLDHPRRVFGGLCHCAKFGWNRHSIVSITGYESFNIFNILRVRLENTYSSPLWGCFGGIGAIALNFGMLDDAKFCGSWFRGFVIQIAQFCNSSSGHSWSPLRQCKHYLTTL